jgi:hypothetical protein
MNSTARTVKIPAEMPVIELSEQRHWIDNPSTPTSFAALLSAPIV